MLGTIHQGLDHVRFAQLRVLRSTQFRVSFLYCMDYSDHNPGNVHYLAACRRLVPFVALLAV
ncbi:hypothetical protein CONPUDRAFT_139872 [Coniophora puteana RWD-64-598 SS2]|uniref:Uncharacterized protein n=1 Tax=Coniophora puteana (strain RWD-64-598) TaxID=741705 RepID=A0A5M3M9R7_CONPW|nr:uncharacterized protein CONPUDRAFT_139872 [Coniophora puteana RWD-64-598 SS2]EIW75929.1 hypothetical protein CONPUDRAFT_139872 [Coniophora puteana RWD-64-598 SS2]